MGLRPSDLGLLMAMAMMGAATLFGTNGWKTCFGNSEVKKNDDPAWVSGLGVVVRHRSRRSVHRKNAIIVLMCIELMLNAANMQFAAAAVHHGDTTGWVYTIFAIAIAASEVAMAAIFRDVRTTRIDYAGRRERPEELR